MSALADAPLVRIWAARDALKTLEPTSDKLPCARDELAAALQALLEEVASTDMPEAERRALDGALSPCAADIKGACFKALRVCACARGFLGLPALMEETRKLLCAAPAKGTAQFLEEALCADVAQCSDMRSLVSVCNLMSFLTGLNIETGQPRLKKELGVELPGPHKKSARTALNKAKAALEALETAQRAAQLAARPKPVYEIPDRDVRLDDAEEAAAREAAHSAAMDALFAKSVSIK